MDTEEVVPLILGFGMIASLGVSFVLVMVDALFPGVLGTVFLGKESPYMLGATVWAVAVVLVAVAVCVTVYLTSTFEKRLMHRGFMAEMALKQREADLKVIEASRRMSREDL